MKPSEHPSNIYAIENSPSKKTATNTIKKSLNQLLDSMGKNKSVISRMADAWGTFSIWIKIGGGLIVFGPLLLIGVLALSTLTIVSTCIFSLLYALISIGLDNHHQTNKNEHDILKSRVLSLSDLLSTVIDNLEKISINLSEDVKRLEETNVSLKEQVEASAKNNANFMQLLTSLWGCLKENKASNHNLNHCIKELNEDAEKFLAALQTLDSVTHELNACLQRHQIMLEKYEALVAQHELKSTDQEQKSNYSPLRYFSRLGLGPTCPTSNGVAYAATGSSNQ